MLKQIVKPITPDSVNNIPIVKEAIDVFLDIVMKHTSIACDISEMLNKFDNYDEIYKQYVKIYAGAIRKVMEDAIHNPKIYNKLKFLHKIIKSDVSEDQFKLDLSALIKLNRDHIIMNKHYTHLKGRPNAIKYIYDLIYDSGLQPVEFKTSNDFRFIPGEHLEYSIEGDMLPELFEALVVPLAHPLGYQYTYRRILQNNFVDFCLTKNIYNIKSIEVISQKAELKEVDDYTSNFGKLYFNNFDGVPLKIGKYGGALKPGDVGYDQGEFVAAYVGLDEPSNLSNALVLNDRKGKVANHNYLVLDNEVEDILAAKTANYEIKEIYFKSGEILHSSTNPKKVVLYWGDSLDVYRFKIAASKIGIKDEELFGLDIWSMEGDRALLEKIDEILIKENDDSALLKKLINNLPKIKQDYTARLTSVGLDLRYDVESVLLIKDKIKFDFAFGFYNTVGSKCVVGAGNIFVDSKKSESVLLVGQKEVHTNIDASFKTIANNKKFETNRVDIGLGMQTDNETWIPSHNINTKNYGKLAPSHLGVPVYNKDELEILNNINIDYNQLLLEKNKVIIEQQKYDEIFDLLKDNFFGDNEVSYSDRFTEYLNSHPEYTVALENLNEAKEVYEKHSRIWEENRRNLANKRNLITLNARGRCLKQVDLNERSTDVFFDKSQIDYFNPNDFKSQYDVLIVTVIDDKVQADPGFKPVDKNYKLNLDKTKFILDFNKLKIDTDRFIDYDRIGVPLYFVIPITDSHINFTTILDGKTNQILIQDDGVSGNLIQNKRTLNGYLNFLNSGGLRGYRINFEIYRITHLPARHDDVEVGMWGGYKAEYKDGYTIKAYRKDV